MYETKDYKREKAWIIDLYLNLKLKGCRQFMLDINFDPPYGHRLCYFQFKMSLPFLGWITISKFQTYNKRKKRS